MGNQLPPESLVPVEDVATRRLLWEEVWDWIIRECERRAVEQEATTPPALPRTSSAG